MTTFTTEIETIVKETEKAFLLNFGDSANVWVPKSQVTIEGDDATMPMWLANKIAQQSTNVMLDIQMNRR